MTSSLFKIGSVHGVGEEKERGEKKEEEKHTPIQKEKEKEIIVHGTANKLLQGTLPGRELIEEQGLQFHESIFRATQQGVISLPSLTRRLHSFCVCSECKQIRQPQTNYTGHSSGTVK